MSKPAARLTDMHTCPMFNGPSPHVGGPVLPPCAPTTLIAGLPAARVGDMAFCAGPPDVIVLGSFTVLIAGKPAARMGDMTGHGGVITVGCPTCLIGEVGSGSGYPQAVTMKAAKQAGAPFTKLDCDKAALGTAGVPPLSDSVSENDPGESARTAWVELELVDEAGKPVAYEKYRITASDGQVREGWLDGNGQARVDNVLPGQCKVTFPELDAEAWS